MGGGSRPIRGLNVYKNGSDGRGEVRAQIKRERGKVTLTLLTSKRGKSHQSGQVFKKNRRRYSKRGVVCTPMKNGGSLEWVEI